MAHIEQNVTTEPHGWINIALRPETDTDARETATWLNTLLHRIYREVHWIDFDQGFHHLYTIFSTDTPQQCPRLQATPKNMDILGR